MLSLLGEIAAALGFFALILVSVGLHELGHFLPSKLFGVKVTQFMIGFGPTIVKFRRGETEYGLKWLPFGGYCAIAGMVPPYREGKDTRLKRFADSIRRSEWADITPDDVASGRLFYQQSFGRRFLIMAGGVTVNLILAFALFQGINWGYGRLGDPSLTVATVTNCLTSEQGDQTCHLTPAAQAGLEPGDQLVALNGQELADYEQYTAALLANVTTDADGQTQALPVTITVERPDVGRLTLPQASGLMAQFNNGEIRPYLGISVERPLIRPGPVTTLEQMGEIAWISLKAIAQLPVLVWQTVEDLVTGQPRDENSVMSVVGAARLAGEVASTDELDRGSKIAVYAALLGSINLFLALLNLVPLLPFDGGHIAAGAYGVVRSAWAKLRRRPDPGPVDAAKLQPIAYAVGAALLLMGVILIVADILSPISLF
ncbi:MAG: site-2 protease family protein [Propionibacteriaceae bacterium]|jgi:membrane-associated protease RseP (regulator of RpoE activity)|nr:site-2 protease family protein [Propionibacteriaceae bacterium]